MRLKDRIAIVTGGGSGLAGIAKGSQKRGKPRCRRYQRQQRSNRRF